MGGLSAKASTFGTERKATECATMLGLAARSTGEDLLPLIARLEERIKNAGHIHDDGITEYRAINFNGSLEDMSPRAARALLHRLEGLRDSMRESEVILEPVILRGDRLRRALTDLRGELGRQGGEGWLSRFLGLKTFVRGLPALIGTLEDMLTNGNGEPIRVSSADYDILAEELVRADGSVEPAGSRHILVDHIAYRDDAGEIVWIFVCRNFSNPPTGRQPRSIRESNDFGFLPNFGPEPVLVPVPVRVRK